MRVPFVLQAIRTKLEKIREDLLKKETTIDVLDKFDTLIKQLNAMIKESKK